MSHKHWLYFRVCLSVVQRDVVIGVFACSVFPQIEQWVYFHSAVTAGQLEKALMLAQEKSSEVGLQCQSWTYWRPYSI